jgi:curved DNA-binding protein CbpA
MAEGALSIKLRCASWQQLATIYKRDLSHGTMFLRATVPPPVGTPVRIDLALPSATVIVLTGVVHGHVSDPQRGAGIELLLDPIPAGSVWLIESALASEYKRRTTPAQGTPLHGSPQVPGPIPPIPAINDSADVSAAEQDLIKALITEAESMRKWNPFLVLGVGYEATDAEVRAAFGELTKRYHPDRFARYESTELRQVAEEIFILIRDAYRRLGDAVARTQLLQSLGKPPPAPHRAPTPPRPIPAASPARAPRAPEREPAPIASASSLGAAAPIRSAASLGTAAPAAPTMPTVPVGPRPVASPARPAAREPVAPPAPPPRRSKPTQPPPITAPLDASPLEELIDQGRLDEALAGYKVMAKKHPNDRNLRAGVELCEGLLALAARDRLSAAPRFEAALEIDPSNERAARELADMRRQATHERKGLLSRLMGKKEP